MLCFIESWFIVFPKGWLAGLSTIGSKLYTYGGLLACLLACWLAGWLACLLPCLLPQPCWFACLHAKWLLALAYLHGWLACLLAGWLACLPHCPLACWLAWPACLAGLLACWLHCERMIGEKHSPGKGKTYPGKIVRQILMDPCYQLVIMDLQCICMFLFI